MLRVGEVAFLSVPQFHMSQLMQQSLMRDGCERRDGYLSLLRVALHVAVGVREEDFLDGECCQCSGLIPCRRLCSLDRLSFGLREHEPMRFPDKCCDNGLLVSASLFFHLAGERHT